MQALASRSQQLSDLIGQTATTTGAIARPEPELSSRRFSSCPAR